MKIGIASDHRGVKVKEKVKGYLYKLGMEVIDYGTNSEESVDYPEYAFKVGQELKKENIDFGILICGTGIGMSIAANKVKKVRCALVSNSHDALLARNHNNANCIALSASTSMFLIKDILDTFLKTPFSSLERHHKRVEMIDNYK